LCDKWYEVIKLITNDKNGRGALPADLPAVAENFFVRRDFVFVMFSAALLSSQQLQQMMWGSGKEGGRGFAVAVSHLPIQQFAIKRNKFVQLLSISMSITNILFLITYLLSPLFFVFLWDLDPERPQKLGKML
jgi:hypothetical protein